MAKAILLYASPTNKGPIGDKITACVVVAADVASAVVLAKALSAGDTAQIWNNATAVDLSAALTTGSIACEYKGTPVAFT